MNAGANRSISSPSCNIGLIAAGLVVTLIGLVSWTFETFAINRHWSTVAVGLLLIGLGGLRRWALAADRGGDTTRW